jgi:hypothetical protein
MEQTSDAISPNEGAPDIGSHRLELIACLSHSPPRLKVLGFDTGEAFSIGVQ